MKRFLPFVIIFLAGALTLTSGTVIYRTKRAELALLAKSIADGKEGMPGAAPPHVHGEAKAPVTLEEFGDFQCPPCQTLALSLTKIEAELGGRLRVIFRQYPLPMHKHAAQAARVSEAAAMQKRFWEMHSLLYRNQAAWSAAEDAGPIFAEFALTLGLDMDRFQHDQESEAVNARVRADQERATSLGVTSTPTVFINGRVVPPMSLNERALQGLIDDTLNGKIAPSSPTPPPSS